MVFLEYLAKPGRPLHSGLLEERPIIRTLGTAVNEHLTVETRPFDILPTSLTIAHPSR